MTLVGLCFSHPQIFQLSRLTHTRLDCVADMELLVQHVKFAKAMINVEPWKATVACEVDPGPNCTTDADIRGSSIMRFCRVIIPVFLIFLSAPPSLPAYRIHQKYPRNVLVSNS